MARGFFNDDGSLRAGLKKAIGDENRIRSASVGGILHLDEVHLLRRYRGRDLGLELIFALLQYLGQSLQGGGDQPRLLLLLHQGRHRVQEPAQLLTEPRLGLRAAGLGIGDQEVATRTW